MLTIVQYNIVYLFLVYQLCWYYFYSDYPLKGNYCRVHNGKDPDSGVSYDSAEFKTEKIPTLGYLMTAWSS